MAQGMSSSPGNNWIFPESERSSYEPTPSFSPLQTLSRTAATSASLAPLTPISPIDPTLQHATSSRTIVAATSRGVVTGKAGALAKFAQYDQKFAELDVWKATMKAAVDVRFKSMEEAFQDEIARVKAQHKTEVEALYERIANDEANKLERNESDSDESDIEMVDTDIAEASLAAMKDNNFLALVRTVFEHHLGVARLMANALPPYPENADEWPTDPSNKERRLLRFRWDQGHEQSENYENLIIITDFIRKKGASYIPAAAKALAVISEEDLKARVIQKFKDLVKVVRDGKKRQKVLGEAGMAGDGATAAKTEGLHEGGNGGGNVVASRPALSKGKRQSRAKGKLEVRKRKRENLPDDLARWKDTKYDAFFTDALMSDDEDGAGALIGNFVSRAPLYRSVELTNLINVVDSAKDPQQALKYTIRVRGEPKDDPPPSSNKLENRARRWMIDPMWLNNNRVYDVPSKIVDNNRAWGDPEDPEDIIAKKLHIKQEKEESKLKIKQRMAMESNGVKVKATGKSKKKKGAQDRGKQKAKEGNGDGPTASTSHGQVQGQENYGDGDDDDAFFAS